MQNSCTIILVNSKVIFPETNIPSKYHLKLRRNYMKIIVQFKITFGLIVRTSTTAASIQFVDQVRINFWLKSSQNKKGRKISSCTIFDSFFSVASCKKRNQKRCSQKIFRPFLFCDGFNNHGLRMRNVHFMAQTKDSAIQTAFSPYFFLKFRDHYILGCFLGEYHFSLSSSVENFGLQV